MNRENTRDTFYLDYIFSERVSTKYLASDRSFVILNNIESESIPQTAVSGSIWLREHVTAKQRRTATNHPRNRNRITLKDCFQREKKTASKYKRSKTNTATVGPESVVSAIRKARKGSAGQKRAQKGRKRSK
ncbi:hypothetical protein AVEN_94305-1 [Araneus ventricosus]|uniref:Uncharacterized protein n=1 Tax=Araneus ventricosus TaxID=182803 RepID=A0A4Y2EV70_ARAVE|nr:hypothetical protein AVEN_234693-1 [Araneus ventricosus]GBM32147.1 hypothetical protein AVEN_268706-1 [Araneus ventricosus]GBM32184.1 hypothetical protein AVEN_61179-1 [Araneus ventricosus]GBM32199.1 hypothetical protein AVEN_94305-1 [Araneus ventricosus]